MDAEFTDESNVVPFHDLKTEPDSILPCLDHHNDPAHVIVIDNGKSKASKSRRILIKYLFQ